jgi:quinol monooxygenase YgiN
MQTYIATVITKPGHADDVADFYQSLEPLLKQAEGFVERKIFRAQNGAMAQWVMKNYSVEELAKHAEPPHDDPGCQFIMVEQWHSLETRMRFAKEVIGGRNRELIPHLLPNHSHEFYEDISVN